MKKSIISQKSFYFAKSIVNLYKDLSTNKKEYILSKQILKSGTSIGANVTEALNAISTKEFSAKMSIAYKEAHETLYWLKLLYSCEYISKAIYKAASEACNELCKILFSIIKTTRLNN